MRHARIGNLLVWMALAASCALWGQGGRAGRGNAPQTTGTQAAPGGRGAAPPASPAAADFFNYDTSAASGVPIPDAAPAETHQKITINGETLAYTTRSGYMPLRNPTSGATEAHLFYTCYTKEGVTDAATRPLLVWVGGSPGVSAAWQEFGGLGPKRMRWAKEGGAGAAPYGWSDNPHTLLGQTDLVFVNPVGTGFSRPDQPGRASSFWNTPADVASLAAFVRGFLTMYNRRESPLYLGGEDFGTGRVASLAGYLHEHQVPVHGAVLLSMTMSADSQAGDAQYITLLPSLIMAAWHHKKLAPELSSMSAEQISGQARQFASRQYLHALYKGDRMTADERTKAVADLSRLTGLSKAFIVNNNLRIPLDRFNAEIMREQRHALSASDARVTGFAPPAPGGGGRGFTALPVPPIDFNLSAISGGFQAAYEGYLRKELGFQSNQSGVFYLNSGGVSGFTAPGSDDAALSAAFARNPQLRLFVAVNYYDLNAPFYATEFTLAHLNVSEEVRARNITISHYEAGAMPYLDNASLPKLHRDLARFVGESNASNK